MGDEWQKITAESIEKTLSILCSDKVAIRMMLRPNKGQERGKIKEGIFDDYTIAGKEVAKYDRKAEIYLTLNPVYSKKGYVINELRDAVTGGSITDADIISRRWMLIDVDSKHPKDVPATEAEWLDALKLANVVKLYLSQFEFSDPIIGSSGNGVHLLYSIDLPNDDESHDVIRRCVNALADKFTHYNATVDRSVHNASRIVRLYGTQNVKGEETDERKYRVSYLKDVPNYIKTVPTEALEKLGERASESIKKISSHNLNVAKSIKHGERNPAMTQIAGRLRRAGLLPEEILSVIQRQNNELCEDPLPDHEIRAIVRSATGWECGPYVEDLDIPKKEEEEVLADSTAHAVELLKSGQFISFCKRIVDRYHKFDDPLKVLMLYNLPRAGYVAPAINLFHLDFTGQPGAGKNSIIVKVAELLPEEHRIVMSSTSDKALYYRTKEEQIVTDDKGKPHVETIINEEVFAGKLLAITEITSGGVTALKAATEIDENTLMSHTTVIDGKHVELSLRGPRVVWTSSVEGLKDTQALDRCWHASLSENTDENRAQKVGLAAHNFSYNTSIYSDQDIPVARAGWKILLTMGNIDEKNLTDNDGIKRNCLEETDQFQKSLLEDLGMKGYETRNLLQFMALCKNIAVVKSFRRGHTSVVIEDVREAWWLLKEFQRETRSRLTIPELKVLDFIKNSNEMYIFPRQTDISKKTKIHSTQISRALSSNEENPGKLLELGYVTREYDKEERATVYEITSLGLMILDKQDDFFVWNGMIYYPKDPLDPVDSRPPRPVTDEDLLKEDSTGGDPYREGALHQYSIAMMRQITILKSPNITYNYNSLKTTIVNNIKTENSEWRIDRIISTFDLLVKNDAKIGAIIQSMVSDFPYLSVGFDEGI